MAQTSTAVNALNCVIMLDDDADTPVDISGDLNEVSLEFEQELGEYRTFTNEWMKRLDGGKDISIDMSAIYSQVDIEARNIIEDWYEAKGARTLTIDVPDSLAGSRRYSGEARIEGMSIPLDVNEAAPIMLAAALKGDGVWTIVTIGS